MALKILKIDEIQRNICLSPYFFSSLKNGLIVIHTQTLEEFLHFSKAAAANEIYWQGWGKGNNPSIKELTHIYEINKDQTNIYHNSEEIMRTTVFGENTNGTILKIGLTTKKDHCCFHTLPFTVEWSKYMSLHRGLITNIRKNEIKTGEL